MPNQGIDYSAEMNVSFAELTAKLIDFMQRVEEARDITSDFASRAKMSYAEVAAQSEHMNKVISEGKGILQEAGVAVAQYAQRSGQTVQAIIAQLAAIPELVNLIPQLTRVSAEASKFAGEIQKVSTASEDVAKIGQVVDPGIFDAATKKVEAYKLQLEALLKIETNLMAVNKRQTFSTVSPEYKSVVAGAQLLGRNLTGMTPQQMFTEEMGAGGLTPAEATARDIGALTQATRLLIQANEKLVAEAAEGKGSLTGYAQALSTLEERSTTLTSKIASLTREMAESKPDSPAQQAFNRDLERTKQEYTKIQQQIRAVRQAQLEMASGATPPSLGEIPFSPSSFYSSPEKMIGSTFRGYMQQIGASEDLTKAMMMKMDPEAFNKIAADWGTAVHNDYQEYLVAMGRASREQIEVPLRGTIEGRPFAGRADFLDPLNKAAVDFKAIRGDLWDEMQKFASGGKQWSQLSDHAKAYFAQLESYRQMANQQLNAGLEKLTFVRAPTISEIGPGKAFSNLRQGFDEMTEQYVKGAGDRIIQVTGDQLKQVTEVGVPEGVKQLEASRMQVGGSYQFRLWTELVDRIQSEIREVSQTMIKQAELDAARQAEAAMARAPYKPLGSQVVIPETPEFATTGQARIAALRGQAAEQRMGLAQTGVTEQELKQNLATLQLLTREDERQVWIAETKLKYQNQLLGQEKAVVTTSERSNKLHVNRLQQLEGEVAAAREQKATADAIFEVDRNAVAIAKERLRAAEETTKATAKAGGVLGETPEMAAQRAKITALTEQGRAEPIGSRERKEAAKSIREEANEVAKVLERESARLRQLKEIERQAAINAARAKEEATLAESRADIERQRFRAASADPQRNLATLHEEASAADKAAVSAKSLADAKDAEAVAATKARAEQQAQVGAYKEMEKGAISTAKSLEQGAKSTSSWEQRLFSLRRVVTVFWGTFLSNIAFTAVAKFQEFFSSSVTLALQAETALARFELMVRSTQRTVSQGFAGAPSGTVGGFAGTVKEWTSDVEAFRKEWKIFTTQEVQAGFKEIMAVTQSANIGREVQLQLTQVAAALTLTEAEFEGNLSKATEALARATEGYTRPLMGTFIGGIREVDQNIKSLELYGKTYGDLGKWAGGASEELKKQQQIAVNAAIIMDRYKNVGNEVNSMMSTSRVKALEYDASIRQNQANIGKNMVPTLINLKSAWASVTGGIDSALGAMNDLNRIAQTKTIEDAIGRLRKGQTVAVGVVPDMSKQRQSIDLLQELTKEQYNQVIAWAKYQTAVKGDTAEAVFKKIEKAISDGTFKIEEFSVKAEEGFGDASEAAQALVDTLSGAKWDPVSAGIDIGDVAKKLHDAWEKMGEDIAQAAVDANEKVLEENSEFFDKIVEIDKDYQDKLVEIDKDAADKRVEAVEKEGEDKVKAWDDYLDAVEKENIDYARRLEDLEDKRNEDAEKRAREHQYKLEDLEIEHNRKLRDIQQQYEFDLDEAANARDARRILELMRQNTFNKQQEDQSYQDRIADENRRYAREEAEAPADLAKERQRLEEDHQRKLEELKESYDRRLEEIAKALAKEFVEIEKNRLKDRFAAAEDRSKALDELEEDHKKRLDKIDENLAKQKQKIEDGYREQNKKILEALDDQVTITEERMQLIFKAVDAALNTDNGYITQVYKDWSSYVGDLISAREAELAAASATSWPTPYAGEYDPTRGYAGGGVVPGPVGRPQIAVVHGGEIIIPANLMSPQSYTATPTATDLASFGRTPAQDMRLLIEVKADEYFSQDFEDQVVGAIADVVGEVATSSGVVR